MSSASFIVSSIEDLGLQVKLCLYTNTPNTHTQNTHTHTRTHKHTHTHTLHTFVGRGSPYSQSRIWVTGYVCVCVREREMARYAACVVHHILNRGPGSTGCERGRARERERGKGHTHTHTHTCMIHLTAPPSLSGFSRQDISKLNLRRQNITKLNLRRPRD